MNDPSPDRRAEAFMSSIAGLLRPLVRALIAQGVTAPALYRLIKRTYVEVAEQEYRLDDARPTDSRISMLTGVHRRDVKDLRAGAGSTEAETRKKVTAIASVLGRWLANAETVDADGQPLPLPRSAKTGISFDALVEGVSRDIRPRTVLDELERQGLVSIDADNDMVHLRTDVFIGPADLRQKVFFFAENVGDHIAAAVDNLLSEEPPFMERAVFYNRLSPASINEIEAQAREKGGSLLVEINRLANERQATDVAASDGTQRFRFGLFFYREEANANSIANLADDADQGSNNDKD
ncbi:MAG: DUF6502 family protein [Pseudomonadota bacterium]